MKLKNCSLKPLVFYHQSGHPIDWARCFNRQVPLEVEIGFGMGEFLVRTAQECRDRNFIGIEQHWERIFKTLRRMDESSSTGQPLDNIRIVQLDARVALERLFTPKSIDKIYSLFPCPWPKKGHVKHRLFSRYFFKLLNNRLKDDGQIKIVTDFYPYCEWILEQIEPREFSVETKTIEPQFDTKFERKWLEEGQEKFFEISLQKIKHVHIPVKEDVSLKAHKLNEFNYDRFEFVDEKGDLTIVLKDSIYDPKRKKAMVHLVVAEEELNQHIWITIVYKQGAWHVVRSQGQNFFPTPGITKALELVYNAAKRSVS